MVEPELAPESFGRRRNKGITCGMQYMGACCALDLSDGSVEAVTGSCMLLCFEMQHCVPPCS